MPLDDLIQRWAAFAHATISAVGLAAASAAFAALAAETAARHVTVSAASPTPAALLDSVYSDLDEARQCWLEALTHLHRLPNGVSDEEAAQLVPTLGTQSLRHYQHLLALSARLCQQTTGPAEADTRPRQRIFLGPLSFTGEAAPEAEEVQRW
jgi:hypothetical protein